MASPPALDRIRENPFYVLGIRPHATRAEVEREGQKLLGMLELGLASAARYATPVGTIDRTADKVRRAMAELRDPERRLEHELWARLPPLAPTTEASEAPRARERAAFPSRGIPKPAREAPRAEEAWPAALVELGWRAPS